MGHTGLSVGRRVGAYLHVGRGVGQVGCSTLIGEAEMVVGPPTIVGATEDGAADGADVGVTIQEV